MRDQELELEWKVAYEKRCRTECKSNDTAGFVITSESWLKWRPLRIK